VNLFIFVRLPSFDRFVPNQDFLTGKSWATVIALPCNKRNAEKAKVVLSTPITLFKLKSGVYKENQKDKNRQT